LKGLIFVLLRFGKRILEGYSSMIIYVSNKQGAGR